MFTRIKILVTCLYLLLCFTAYAQIKSEITHYSTKDGLSHDGVLCITRDRDGFMWFGTFDGINRFDGHSFVIYKSRPGDSSNLRSNKIRDIVEDQAGYLWIETFDYKLYRFNKATEQFLAIFEGPYKRLFNDQVVINRIFPDHTGVWLFTRLSGMYYVQSSRNHLPVITRFNKDADGGNHIKGNIVKFHQADSQGNIWIGTDGGLDVLQRNTSGGYRVKKFDEVTNSLLSSTAFSCAVYHAGNMYLGTSDGRVIIYNLAQKTFRTISIAPHKQLNDVCISRTGVFYISTAGSGLLKFDPLTLITTPLPTEAGAVYNTLYEDPAGNIWIEPEKSGVIKYDPHTGIYKHFMQKIDYPGAGRDYHVFTDANSITWVSMKGGGFGYYNPNTDQVDYFYDEPGSYDQKFSNAITCLYMDKTGVLWMSGKDGGVNKVISQADRFYFHQPAAQPQNRSENDVRAMMKDANGLLWICTKDGLVHIYDHDKEVNVFTNSGNKIGFVYCMLQDKTGNIWLGTKGNGLYKAIPNDKSGNHYTLTNYRHNDNDPYSISGNVIYSLLQDHKGRIWVGAFGSGLNLIINNNGKDGFKNYANSFHSYPYSWAKVIRDLCEDNKGRIWIATTYGLLVFNPEEQQGGNYHFMACHKVPNNSYSLGNNSVQCITKDHTGQIWLGTFGGGLNKVLIDHDDINHVRFKALTMTDGLPNDVVLSMTTDHQNNIWIATAGGLSKFNPARQTFKNYDPFGSGTKTTFSEATCFTATNGTLYFGCINGYISFNPKSIVNKRLPAHIALTNIQLYYKNIAPGKDNSPLTYAINETKTLTLKHDQNVISIDYAVLDYRAVNKIAYSYILEGFDKSWHSVNDLRKAVYTNIPPGEYTFRVKGVSEDILSNTPEKSLHIIIKPPFYLTILAYFIYLILIVLAAMLARNIIVTMIRLRNKVVVEQRLTEVKLAFFTNISHELRTPLTLIASPLEELSRTETLSVKGREYFNIIMRNVNRMIRFTNQLLDFRKVQSGKIQMNIAETDLVSLINEVGSYFRTMAEEKNIDFRIHADKMQLQAWVDEEKIEIILYNLLSNAFKFSPSGKKIVLEIKHFTNSGLIEIRVIDQGKGVPEDRLEEIFEIYHEESFSRENHLKGTGIGLALARGLALSHKGKLWAERNETEGMTFILQLKTGHDHFTNDELSFAGTGQLVEPALETNVEPKAIPNKSTAESQLSLVLIVEDNPDLRTFLENKLNDCYQVLTAGDGAEGLKIARSAYPDLIISDVVMPVMDGIQMLDAVKHDPAISHIPVVLLTAKSSVENRIKALKYGADVYLTKPFQNELLMASVENLLESRKRMFERFAIDPKSPDLHQTDDAEMPVTTLKDEAFLKDVIRIVDEKLGDQDFNIDEVAAGMSMGRTTFYKKLKSLSSLSPVEFVRELRLKRSKQLLDTGAHTVSEAGYMSGFNSLAYFSTCFKEKFGVSPSVYLKKLKDKSL